MTTVWLILSILILITGFLGTVVPILPGTPLIFLAYLIWGLASHWQDYSTTTLLVVGIVTVITVAGDYYAGGIGAKKFGASAAGVWGAIIGAIIGVVFFNIPGLILGPFLGAVAGELLAGRSKSEAWRAGWGAFLGFVAGTLFKIIVGTILTILFFYFLLF